MAQPATLTRDRFGPSPAFGSAHPGLTLVPAQSHPRPADYDGSSAGAHLLVWAALILVAALAVAVTFAIRRR
jgi:hypothetical protein